MEKSDAKKLPLEALNERHRRAVNLRLKEKTWKKVSEKAELSITHMPVGVCGLGGGWLGRRGCEEARPQAGFRRLGWEQEKHIQRLILDKTPDGLKLGFALRNRQAVRMMIKQEFGVDLPVRMVGEYLRRWGYTPRKPIQRVYEQNPVGVEEGVDPSLRKLQKSPERVKSYFQHEPVRYAS